jgi:hypothetical protein
VRSTKRRKKVVEHGFVRQIDYGKLRAPFVFVVVKDVVVTNEEIKQVSRMRWGLPAFREQTRLTGHKRASQYRSGKIPEAPFWPGITSGLNFINSRFVSEHIQLE